MPDVAWKLPQRWDAVLGEMAVPLRPEGGFVLCQVEGIDNGASLPAIVSRRLGSQLWIGTVRNMTKPNTFRLSGVNIGRRSWTQTAPGDSIPETTFATLRASPAAIRSSGFLSSSASIGFESQTGM